MGRSTRPQQQKRHWPWTVGALALSLCLGIIALPVSWAARLTLDADQGEIAPEAAVEMYLGRLVSGDRIGLPRVLDNGLHGAQFSQWEKIRADMERSRTPNKLETGAYEVQYHDEKRATVIANVRAVFWNLDPNRKSGEPVSLTGSAHEWRWETIERNGWRITKAVIPEWCGTHIKATLCK